MNWLKIKINGKKALYYKMVKKETREFFFFTMYPKNDLNVHDITSTKLKFVLSTNSSTRTFFFLIDLLSFGGWSLTFFFTYIMID